MAQDRIGLPENLEDYFDAYTRDGYLILQPMDNRVERKTICGYTFMRNREINDKKQRMLELLKYVMQTEKLPSRILTHETKIFVHPNEYYIYKDILKNYQFNPCDLVVSPEIFLAPYMVFKNVSVPVL